jgi:LuxR family maltose regulon positive regulatory protein
MSSVTVPRETQIPHVSGVISRPRLLAKLQFALEHKLTLICAPPGYGKTTTAAQFAIQSPEAIAWHALEERERDLPNLYNQSLLALEPVAPGIRTLAPMPGFFPSELATLVTDYLRNNTSRRIVYILDDIQLISGSPAAEVWLQTFVERMPANCHLILIGRVLPNLPLTEMIARGEVLALGQEQLRFTPAEIYELAHVTSSTALSMAEAEDLAERLEGWPAGIVLALHPLPHDLEHLILHEGTGPEALFNSLAGSMLDAQPPGLRDFLLSSSTLLRMTPELCSTVLQISDSSHWLAEAQQRGLFLSKVSGGLVYHRLFRNFLQQQLKNDNPRLFLNFHTRAARWFEEHNWIDWSFEHYMAAGLIERAAKISDKVAHMYFSQGKVETLLEWRSGLGQVGIFAPSLLYNCACVHTDRYNYDEAEKALDEAHRGFLAVDDQAGLARVQLQRAFIRLQRGEFHTAAIEAAHLAETLPGQPDLQGRALKILGVAHLRLGEATSAVEYLEQALTLHRADGDAHSLANALQDLSVAYSRLGQLGDASACLQEVVALRRSLGSPSALAAALNNLGYYYHRGGDYERALVTFQEGLSILARVPNRRVESAILWSLGDLRRDQGAFEESLKLQNRALALVGNSDPWLRSAVLVSCSTLHRWWGRMREAESLALKAGTLADRHELALERATARASLWAARAQLGQAAAARDHLEAVISELKDQGARSELAWVHALAATADLLCSDVKSVEDRMRLAVQEAKETGTLQALVVEIGNTPLLETFVIQNAGRYGDLIGALKHLRAAQTNVHHAPQLRQVDPQTTYSLRIFTLGRERLERDGEEVSLSEWRSTTAREMFYYLMFHGAESREQICLEFWPDSSTQHVRSNFHTTLYRARQALGENVIVFRDGVYVLNPDLDLWCDAHELENLVQQARLLPARDARTEDLWRRAADLYQGDFLPSWDAEWATSYRESLLDMYFEALLGLGHCASARKDYRGAIEAYKRAVYVDPFREDVHRAIMTCFAELGEKKQVLDHLQRLQVLLRDELAIDPSEETMTLAKALLR